MLIVGSGLDIFSLHIFDVSPSRSSSKAREQMTAAVVGVRGAGAAILQVIEEAAAGAVDSS